MKPVYPFGTVVDTIVPAEHVDEQTSLNRYFVVATHEQGLDAMEAPVPLRNMPVLSTLLAAFASTQVLPQSE